MKIKRIPEYLSLIKDWLQYRKLARSRGQTLPSWRNIKFVCGEKEKMHLVNHERFYLSGWASRIIRKISPSIHYDISSDLTFIVTISAFIPVKAYNFQLIEPSFRDLQFEQVNILELPFQDESIESLSCLHVVEHVGLGRYGDALDPEGMNKAFIELSRVIKKGGHLLLALPVGEEITFFNATRVCNLQKTIESFSSFQLKEYEIFSDPLFAHFNFKTKKMISMCCLWLIKNK